MIATRISEEMEVRLSRTTGEKSLHASTVFNPGDVLSDFDAEESLEIPTYLTLQCDDNSHIMLMPDHLRFINHSCDPNCYFDTERKEVLCIKRIEPGDEITHFYPATEWYMSRKFHCRCGHDQCLGYIEGAAFVHPDILGNYTLADHVKKKISGL